MINHDLIKNHNIILASQSPRRRELIMGLDLEVTIAQNYAVDETIDKSIPAESVPMILSEKKAKEYPFSLLPNDILITSDTIVCINEIALGKPIDRNQAIDMLKMLSGKQHKVITAVTLRAENSFHTFDQITEVTFKKLELDDIIYYIDKYKPYDKAGAYAIQEWIGYVAIEKINGSFYNVMGLPVCRLYTELENFISR